MKKISSLVLLVILAISLESCSLFGSKNEEDATSANSPNPSATNSQSEQASNPEPTSTNQENSAESPDKVDINGLIPATNPDVRVSGSIRGRQDPFAIITLQPQITTKETDEGKTDRSKSPTPTNPNPNDIKTTPTIDSLVENQPVATLAQNVIVSGLVELGGQTKIIVQAPEEATSRYVSVGSYLSNGKILVKQIIAPDSFSTPQVVLEENGVETIKTIGEQLATEESSEQPQAGNPLPTSSLDGSVSWVSNYLSNKTQ
jgi:hypothetical protein